MQYGVAEAGMAEVVSVAVNAPPLSDTVFDTPAPLIVTVTLSVSGGVAEGAISLPDKLMLAVPNGMVRDAVRLLNTGVALFTVRVPVVVAELVPKFGFVAAGL